MREHPILFQPAMVAAILAGRKTQTRRHAKGGGNQKCPYGQAGDVLWVRETFCPVDDGEEGVWVDYRATPRWESSSPAGWDNAPDDPEALKWKPSIFMPKKYCRLRLEVIETRLEWLQDITDADALAEGIYPAPNDMYGWGDEHIYDTPTKAYRSLWEKINGKDSWALNPLVWRITFEREKR